MTEQIPPILRPFVTEKVVLPQTRKRDGTWVDTPVNIAVKGARVLPDSRTCREEQATPQLP